MEPSKAIAFVRRYNAWRRCDEDSEQPHPREIGIALDSLCDHAERLERELAAERALADSLAAALAVYKGYLEHAVHRMPAPAQNKADEALAAWKEARHEP